MALLLKMISGYFSASKKSAEPRCASRLASPVVMPFTWTVISKSPFSGRAVSSSIRPRAVPSLPRTVLSIMCLTEKLTEVCAGSMYQNICFPLAGSLPAGSCWYNQLVAYASYSEDPAAAADAGRATGMAGLHDRVGRGHPRHGPRLAGHERTPACRASPARRARRGPRRRYPTDRSGGSVDAHEERTHACGRPAPVGWPDRASRMSLRRSRAAHRTNRQGPAGFTARGARILPRGRATFRGSPHRTRDRSGHQRVRTDRRGGSRLEGPASSGGAKTWPIRRAWSSYRD